MASAFDLADSGRWAPEFLRRDGWSWDNKNKELEIGGYHVHWSGWHALFNQDACVAYWAAYLLTPPGRTILSPAFGRPYEYKEYEIIDYSGGGLMPGRYRGDGATLSEMARAEKRASWERLMAHLLVEPKRAEGAWANFVMLETAPTVGLGAKEAEAWTANGTIKDGTHACERCAQPLNVTDLVCWKCGSNRIARA